MVIIINFSTTTTTTVTVTITITTTTIFIIYVHRSAVTNEFDVDGTRCATLPEVSRGNLKVIYVENPLNRKMVRTEVSSNEISEISGGGGGGSGNSGNDSQVT